MTVGIPGAGIGGIFYLLSALLMPFHEAARIAQGRGTMRGAREALLQAAIAAGVLGAIWAFGAWLGFVLAPEPGVAAAGAAAHSAGSANVLGRAAVITPLATLGAILLGTELLRVFLRRPAPAARPALAPVVDAVGAD